MSHISNQVPPQSNQSLEDMATRVRNILRPHGIRDDLRFPIVDVIEHVMPRLMADFYFGIMSWEELQGAEALKTPDNGILVREDVYELALEHEGRARFTLTHELGHLILHPSHVLHRISQAGSPPKIYCDPEWQANTFAGALLMPSGELLGLDVDGVMEKFGVSRQAAEVRLKKLKYR